ncbi:MAG: hypothetical protein ACM3UY_03810 [Methanocella sp.]
MKGWQIALYIGFTLGIVLLIYSLFIGTMIGANWFGENAHDQWHMNNYFVIEGQYAYSIFGIATMIIGGLATGITMTAFLNYHKTRKTVLILSTAFIIAIIMTGLGFNTLDFMLGGFYWTNQTYPPPVQVPLFGSVDVWNFYFFFFVVPLWASGYFIGSSSAYFTFIHKPLKAAGAYVAKQNFGILHQPQPKAYFAESRTHWRTPGVTTSAFDGTN